MSDWTNSFIEDGYNESGYISAEEGIHGALEFEYRPMIPSVQGRILEKKETEAFVDAVCKALIRESHLKSWSLKDSKGTAVPLTEANLKRIKPRLFDKLWTTIAGLRPSDRDPKAIDLEADAKN